MIVQRSFIAVLLILITLVSVGLLLIDQLFDITDSFKFTIIVAIGTIASGISAVIMSYSTIRASQFEAINRYFSSGNTDDKIVHRGKIYEYEENLREFDEKAASVLCNHYQL